MPFLIARQINKSYVVGSQRLHVLRDLDLSVEHGEMVAVVGASGVGKSTLLHLLGGLDMPSEGEIRVLGADIRHQSEAERGETRNRALGFVYQFHHLLPEFTALET